MDCPGRPLRVLIVVLGLSIPAGAKEISRTQTPLQQIAAKLEKDRVAVTIDGQLFTCYKFAASQKYPYFWPVNGPASGKSITTETSQPYPHHHSLFFGCDRVNGGNYWQEENERGQIVSQGPTIIEPSGTQIIFTDTCLWRQPGADPVIRDRRRVTITASGKDLRFIDFEITLEPLTGVQILKTNHSLFSARVVPELSVKSGGTLINAEGKSGEKGTWGIPSAWCDYSGTREGHAEGGLDPAQGNALAEGIAILQHPKNRWFPAKWFTRDYGFFSPTPMNWLENDRLDLPKGQTLTLRYRVVVHAGNAQTAQIADIFHQYEQAAKAPAESEATAPTTIQPLRPQNAHSSQSSHSARYLPLQSSKIPILDNAKSYFTGSFGSISAKLCVICTALAKETVFRSYSPRTLHNLAICTSTGTISLALSTDFHSPGSTSSSRTIHRRKRLSRLQALPEDGLGSKYLNPFGTTPPFPSAYRAKSESQNLASAALTFSSPPLYPSKKYFSIVPYSSRTLPSSLSKSEISSPVVKRCLKPDSLFCPASLKPLTNAYGLSPMRLNKSVRLFSICCTRPYANSAAKNATIS
jgi:hypothetical protein